MEQESGVVLYGCWYGSQTKRIELGLKLKGIPYLYIEEDLSNKSELLLQYNPIHKTVPVLVHNNKPVVESLAILEYMDEYWNNTPRFLPVDPYERAKVQFWANFFYQKFSRTSRVLAEGEEQVKAIEEFKENVGALEQGIKRDFSGKGPFFHGENPGFLDIVVGSSACTYPSIEEAIGLQLIDPETYPNYFSWVTELKNYFLVEETLPPQEKLVQLIRNYRQGIHHQPKSP